MFNKDNVTPHGFIHSASVRDENEDEDRTAFNTELIDRRNSST